MTDDRLFPIALAIWDGTVADVLADNGIPIDRDTMTAVTAYFATILLFQHPPGEDEDILADIAAMARQEVKQRRAMHDMGKIKGRA